MLRDTPCVKKRLCIIKIWNGLRLFLQSICKGELCLGLQKWALRSQTSLKFFMKFEDMPSFFFTKQNPDEAVPHHMKDYLQRTSRKRGDGKSWLEHYQRKSCCCMLYCYAWYVEQVKEARHIVDVEKNKALLAKVFKQLRNSGYLKLTILRTYGSDISPLSNLHI